MNPFTWNLSSSHFSLNNVMDTTFLFFEPLCLMVSISNNFLCTIFFFYSYPTLGLKPLKAVIISFLPFSSETWCLELSFGIRPGFKHTLYKLSFGTLSQCKVLWDNDWKLMLHIWWPEFFIVKNNQKAKMISAHCPAHLDT